MLITTPGIVLHSTKYSDTSLIVKIYTYEQGTQSFIIKGAFSKKGKIRASFFMPLSQLSITYNDPGKETLKFLKEVSRADDSLDVQFDPVKSSIILFYNEILYKLLFDAGPDPMLFRFITEEIHRVHEQESNLADLPIRFLIRLSSNLGFYPENNYSEKECFFSLEESRFQSYFIDERCELSKEESFYLSQLLNNDPDAVASRQMRNLLLHHLIAYFRIHNEQLKEISSIEVLSSVLR